MRPAASCSSTAPPPPAPAFRGGMDQASFGSEAAGLRRIGRRRLSGREHQPVSRAKTPQEAPMGFFIKRVMADSRDKRIRCSFCGKHADDDAKLISGPGVCICDECIELCNRILAEEGVTNR
jgi:hypothetical protein